MKQNNEIKLTDKQYEEFGKKFLQFYLESGFGNKSKSNLEIYIFDQLDSMGYFSDCETTAEKAIKLKIAPTKVNVLLLQCALYNGFSVEKYTSRILQYLGSNARSMNKNRISFDIDDSRVRMAIKTICSKKKIHTDTSFNTNIITFPLQSYEDLIRTFIPKGKEKDFNKSLLEGIKSVKLDIKKEKFKNNPIVQVILKAVEKVADNAIDTVSPTSLIINALKKVM